MAAFIMAYSFTDNPPTTEEEGGYIVGPFLDYFRVSHARSKSDTALYFPRSVEPQKVRESFHYCFLYFLANFLCSKPVQWTLLLWS